MILHQKYTQQGHRAFNFQPYIRTFFSSFVKCRRALNSALRKSARKNAWRDRPHALQLGKGTPGCPFPDGGLKSSVRDFNQWKSHQRTAALGAEPCPLKPG